MTTGPSDTYLGRRVDGIVVAELLRNGSASERQRKLHVPVVETWDRQRGIACTYHLHSLNPRH